MFICLLILSIFSAKQTVKKTFYNQILERATSHSMKNTKMSVGKVGFGIRHNTFTHRAYGKETFDHKERKYQIILHVPLICSPVNISSLSLYGSAVLLLYLGRFLFLDLFTY
jgi:hypothetical protein